MYRVISVQTEPTCLEKKVSHWGACLCGFFSDDGSGDSMIDLGLLSHPGLPDSVFSRYVIAIYWSAKTFMAIGYGNISAETTTERFFSCVMMFFSCAYFAFLVSSFMAGIRNAMAPETREMTRMLDRSSKALQERGVRTDLQTRLFI